MMRVRLTKTGEKADRTTAFNALKKILATIFSEYKYEFWAAALFVILSSAAGMFGAVFLQILIDTYIIPLIGTESPDFTPLFIALGIMAAIYIVGVVSVWAFNRLMVIISQGVQKTIRDRLFNHMQKLPLKFFHENSHGDLMSRFTNDVDSLRNLLAEGLPQVFSAVLIVVLTLGAMIVLSPILATVVIITIGLNLGVTAVVGNKSAKYFKEQQEALGKLNGHVEEMVTNQQVVKIFNRESQSFDKFAELNNDFEKNSFLANCYANMFLPIMLNLGSLQYVAIAITGGILAATGAAVTLGTIAAFLQLSRTLYLPLGSLAMQINAVVMALAGAARIYKIMDEEEEQDEGYIVQTEKNGKLFWETNRLIPENQGQIESPIEIKGEIEIKNLNFGYKDDLVLKNISLEIKPGEKLAIVGSTGAGKTTITNLINRFYDIKSGNIFYDGIDINHIQKSHLRNSIGMVLQDTELFTTTVMENIRYGNLNAADEEVEKAAKLANAHSFIELLPEGYNTVLEKAGANLSQGQRQLLSIARAYAANPPVMILDEATGSIDTRTEAIIQKSMDSIMEGRTVFVIAHRLSTVKNAGVIIVLENGEIIEQGSHRELMEQQGRYYNMYKGGLSFDEF